MQKVSKKEIIVESILWVLVMLLAAFWAMNATSPVGKIVSSFNVIITCVVLPYYLSNRLITPKYLIGKKITHFVVFTTLILILNPLLAYFLNYQLKNILSDSPIVYAFDTIKRTIYVLFWNSLLAVVLGTGARLLLHYFITERKIQEIEQQKIKAELNFLRSQINPHFLFNVMNTLYFQIDKENTAARHAVEKFSEILRYQLQIENKDTVSIAEEIAYMKNYCALQQLRLEAGTDVELCIHDDVKDVQLAPLLFVPIIENAFKYISNYTPATRNYIRIMLEIVSENYLQLRVVNTVEKNNIANGIPFKSSGLGLQNLEKRLAIIYPERHLLLYQLHDGYYETVLQIRGLW